MPPAHPQSDFFFLIYFYFDNQFKHQSQKFTPLAFDLIKKKPGLSMPTQFVIDGGQADYICTLLFLEPIIIPVE